MTATRGTTNGNARGSSAARLARRQWLVQNYRADVDACDLCPDLITVPPPSGLAIPIEPHALPIGVGDPACRCYRCGVLLTVRTVTVDRIIPGCQGGTYRRTNIRPACGRCNSQTGGWTRAKRGK